MPPTVGVPIALGDGTKKRTLRYNWERLEQAEQVLGAVGLADIQRRLGAVSMRTISTMVWIGLLHADPELTREEVVEKLDTRKLQDITTAVGEAIKAAFPKKEEPGQGGNGGAAT